MPSVVPDCLAVRGCTALRGATQCRPPSIARDDASSSLSRPRDAGTARAQNAQPEHDARSGRRHRCAHGAADRRRAGRRHRDRRGRNPAQRRAEPGRIAAAAAWRRDRAERRPGLGVRRAAARRQPRPDAGADRRPARGLVVVGVDDARSDSARPDRPHRDPARARVEPVRRRRHRRRRPGVHEAAAGRGASRRTSPPATAPTTPAPCPRASPATTESLRYSLQAGGRSSDGFNAIVNPDNYSYNPDRDGFSTKNLSANAQLDLGSRDRNSLLQYFGNRLEQPVRRRRSVFRRSHDHDGAGVERDQPQPDQRCLDVAADRRAKAATTRTRRPASATSTFKTTQRQYFWQNDFTLPMGALGVILERREEHLATDADFATTQRNTNSATGVYQLRYDAFALQANLRRDDSNQYGGKTTGGIALGYTLSPAWRVTAGVQHRLQGAVVQRSLLSGLLQSGPGAGNVAERRGRRVLERVARRRALGSARDRLPQPGERTHRVRSATPTSTALPQNVDRATLEGVTLGLDLTWRDTRVTASLDLQNPDGRRDRQSAAATRAHARRRAGAAAGRTGAAGRRVRRVVAALRRRGGHGEDGRLRHRQSHGRVAVRERVVAARARQQRAQQELPAGRRLFDGRCDGLREACAGSRDARATGAARRAAPGGDGRRVRRRARQSPRPTTPATS